MEAQTDVQTYMEQGKQALAQGQARDAAIAYAHAAQIEPDNPYIHLGLAEANLALGSYGVVTMACRRVQELQPQGGAAYSLAQALLDLMDRRYDRALQNLETVINDDPANAYAHAMRAYLLRIQGQDYDAGLARARAARLSYGGHFENCFPPVEPLNRPGYGGVAIPPGTNGSPDGQTMPRAEREQVPTWTRPNQMQRQVVRTRFWLSQNPRFITYTLIIINVVVFLIGIINPGIYDFGVQYNPLIMQGEYWRILTAMFLHAPLPNIMHIALNMLSLFFIGPVVEAFYGKWRYLLIYLLSGIAGGLFYLFVDPQGVPTLGASGAIFGVFGALGVFYLVNRHALGGIGRAAITNWLFWLGLNLVLGFSIPGINILDHIGGLIAGIVLGLLLIPRLRRRRVA